MSKHTFSKVLKDSKGFTLVELLAVMAIIGVLAAILTPIVSQSGESAREAQIKQDIGTTEGVISKVFSERQSNAEVLTPESVTVTASINGDVAALTTQNISSRYPEEFITHEGASSTSVYSSEFPTSASDTDNIVIKVTLVDQDGTAISRADFFDKYTAIDFTDLKANGFITERPKSVSAVSTVNGKKYHSTLWLLRKSTSAGGETYDARSVVVMKLLTVVVTEGTGTVSLSYGSLN